VYRNGNGASAGHVRAPPLRWSFGERYVGPMGACDEIPEDEADPPSYRLHLTTTAIDVQIPPSPLQSA
jgi:hypothetical protein